MKALRQTWQNLGGHARADQVPVCYLAYICIQMHTIQLAPNLPECRDCVSLAVSVYKNYLYEICIVQRWWN